jgi:hypothetical protein
MMGFVGDQIPQESDGVRLKPLHSPAICERASEK